MVLSQDQRSRSGSTVSLLESETIEVPKLSVIRLLLLSMFWFGYQMTWTVIGVEVLPGQVAALGGEENSGTNLAIVYSAGAVVSLLNPVIGNFSDHCRFRFGKRRIFLLIGAAGSTLFLVGIAYSSSLVVLCISFLIFDAFSVVAAAPFNGLLSDVTPEYQKGTMSGVIAGIGLLGNLTGSGFGVLYGLKGIEVTMFAVAAVWAVASALTILGVSEIPIDPKHSIPTSSFAETMKSYIKPLRNHDFRWVFITRLLMEMGVFSLQENLLYFLSQDYVIKIDDWSGKIALSSCLVPLLICGGTASVVVGHLSDVYQKRKIFVVIAGIFMFAGSMMNVFLRDLRFLIGASAVFGLGYGIYNAVDYAIALDVLPNKEDAGKDLNVWYLSLIIPQVVAVPIGGALIRSMHYSSLSFGILFSVTAAYSLASGVLIRNVRGIK